MNKKALFIIIGIVLLALAAVVYVATAPHRRAVVNETTLPAKNQVADDPKSTEPTTAQPGVYRDYSDAAIASTKGTKLIFFHASWCPQCRKIEASIDKDGIPSGITVFKADYDSNQELRQKYGVTIQTTFVKIDDSGNKIKSYVAYEEPEFSAVKRNLLE